jgi:hypothetical protein
MRGCSLRQETWYRGEIERLERLVGNAEVILKALAKSDIHNVDLTNVYWMAKESGEQVTQKDSAK